MSIRLEVVNSAQARRFIRSAKNIGFNTQRGLEKGWWQSGKDINAEFSKQVLAKNKTGRLYIRVDKIGRRRKHRASAPGETPANRTGHYRRSREFIVRSWKELVIGNTASYSGFLERGTRKMKPRPGISNAIIASERDIIRNLADEIKDAI